MKPDQQHYTDIKPSATSVWTANIGLILVAIGTLLPIIHLGTDWFKWIYAAGALFTLIGRVLSFNTYRKAPLRVKRLSRMEFWAAMLFATGTFFLFYRQAGPTDWLAFTLAGAGLQAYSSIMLPRAIEKSAGNDAQK